MKKQSVTGITVDGVDLQTYLDDSPQAEVERKRLVDSGVDKPFLYHKPRARSRSRIDRRPGQVMRLQSEINQRNLENQIRKSLDENPNDDKTWQRESIVACLMCITKEEGETLQDIIDSVQLSLSGKFTQEYLDKMAYQFRAHMGQIARKTWIGQEFTIVNKVKPTRYIPSDKLKNRTFEDEMHRLHDNVTKKEMENALAGVDLTTDKPKVMDPPGPDTEKITEQFKDLDKPVTIKVTGPIHLHFHINVNFGSHGARRETS